MSHLTRVANYPDRADIKKGMAHFEGSGPIGKTCESCQHRGYHRTGGFKFNKQAGMLEEKQYSSKGCRMFLKLTHKHGPEIKKHWRACKYYTPITEDLMPKVSDVYKPTVIRVGELNGADTVSHILGNYREEIVSGYPAYVLDVEFAGTKRVLKVGTMLANDIAGALGDEEIDHWSGRAVTLYPYKQKITESNGDGNKIDKLVDMIRAKAAPEDTPIRKVVPSIRNDDPDSIPF